ncbi:MAG: aromatic ring-hydroxylating dioxygenase subunit alpha [Alphaproteobacteria bacterium]
MSPEVQETLTRVGPGTPMGALLRRYWHPVAASSELAAKPAKRVRLLGEDLVLFRDQRGALGLLQERCPHRGASLAYGCVEDDGLRCAYHGWKFGASGTCLETPTEPSDSRLKDRVRAKAYKAAELGGLIFGYLGPEPAPLLPRYDLYVWDNALRDIGQAMVPCNWLQIMENSMDPYHVEWLHGRHFASLRRGLGEDGPLPYAKRHVKVGFDLFKYGVIKRRVIEGGSEEDDDWKVGHPLVFPNLLRVGAHWEHTFQIRVPVDDTHTWHLWYACYKPGPGVAVPPQKEIPLYDVPWRDANGDFIVDFVDGQDICVTVSQGPIADRTKEHLGKCDIGVAMLRKLLLEQIGTVQAGGDPLGVIRDPAENGIIELPQESKKYGDDRGHRLAALELGYSRHSPIKDQIRKLLEAAK